MIDIILAIVVLLAVLLFGALMVAGNERQRKAIDSLNTSYSRWAERDLVLKRASAARSIQVEDPRIWLEQIATQILGVAPKATSLSRWESGDAKAMLALCPDGRKLVLTPTPPVSFRKMITARKRTGAGAAITRTMVGLLGNHPGRVPWYELNIISAGTFFDVEAGLVWERLFNEKITVDRLYMFDVPQEGHKK
jgi:hypothetical protein